MHRATMKPYSVLGKTYYPTQVSMGDSFSGVASWYGKDFHAKKTSNGEVYNMYDMTAAHKTLPMNTMLKVTNLSNERSAIVRVNDRGPFVKSRIIDLSYAAASRLDMQTKGTAPIRIEVIGFNGVIGDMQHKQSVMMDNYFVQIGAFRNKNGAQRYTSDNASVQGRYKATLRESMLDNTPIYRVWLSGFGSESEARDFIDQGQFGGSFITRE
ncbi:MAG: septal ring lytic transglycosylase RlpA family protein [Sulfurospirillum sp.]|nr:septal ring lytic transglycosylase RlpA family protein [Sulfurospirillum sp.]